MSVILLGGKLKGLKLITPVSSITRPTSVMLKRRLFDSIQDFSGIRFIDICAGSGSIGLEAASRGADEVLFIESNFKALSCLKKNIKSYSDRDKNSILKAIGKDFQKSLKQIDLKYYNFIYFDPPYEKKTLYEFFFEFIKDSNFNGKCLIEGCEQKTMKLSEFYSYFGTPNKIFKQGTNFLLVYDFC
ncbi:MAG: RsmD family RNA methyltransferase [Bacteriovoracaceae bacterium]|jgi:16S rRNA (guanine966-N2)-methyltransferase|nr:RsmD family RNA methyltransferase [Bacteriovoracaceae bacterium]